MFDPAAKLAAVIRRLRYPFLRHEGMTSFAERIQLYRSAAHAPGGTIVELGPYFGASTVALAAGLSRNPSPGRALHVFDCFKTRIDAPFAQRVRQSAARSNTAALLTSEDGWLFWDACFERLVARYSGALTVHKTLLDEAVWSGDEIHLLHLDLPKDYRAGRIAFEKFLPSLDTGAIILFQDFVYQWSAEMIAAFGLLIYSGGLRPDNVVSTTLAMTCVAPGTELLAKLDALMDTGPETIDRGIEFALDAVAPWMSGEQRAVLRLALCQHRYRTGRPERALTELGEVLAVHPSSPAVARAAAELLAWGFVQENSYE